MMSMWWGYVALPVAGLVAWLALRPGQMAPIVEVPEEPLPRFRVEALGMVPSIGDALVYIDAVQGMHPERLRYRVLIREDGTEMVEIYKVVTCPA